MCVALKEFPNWSWFYRFIGAGKLVPVFSIASSVQKNLFSVFLYRFIGAGKLVFGFFYRFIGEKIFAQQNGIALFDFFLINCLSVSL
jgi:hypothetical protein